MENTAVTFPPGYVTLVNGIVTGQAPPDCLYVGRVFSGTGITTLTITQAHIDRWVTLRKPNCWCCDAQKRGNGVYLPSSTSLKVDALDLAKVKNSAVAAVARICRLQCQSMLRYEPLR